MAEDAGIEPRTVATLALTVRQSNYSFRFRPRDVLFKHSRIFDIHCPIYCKEKNVAFLCPMERKQFTYEMMIGITLRCTVERYYTKYKAIQRPKEY